MTSSSSYASFEDVYKTAYSHGLEAIYAIENVDLKTVRRIAEDTPKKTQQVLRSQITFQDDLSNQFEFDFGDEYRGWIDSFVLEEPIQVLSLSRLAEKSLCDNGKTLLKHIYKANLRDFVFFKGMGQGHLDEIQQKISGYLMDHVLYKCRSVDFSSWLRTLTATLNKKKIFVCLEEFQLSDTLTLSPAESVEVRRLTLEKRREWIQEIREELSSEEKKKQVKEGFQKIVNVFIKPWVRRRQGFATEQEIQERIRQIAVQPGKVSLILNFLSSIYFEGQFPLREHFFINNDTLFFADQNTQRFYSQFITKTLSYFYKENISYSLSEITAYLTREYAKSWEVFPENFIEKALRQSSHFSVRKAQSKQLIVKLAPHFNPNS